MTTDSYNPNWDPDALVSFHLLSADEGGKSNPVFSGYRPNYKIMEEYLTSTDHFFIDNEMVKPGESSKAFVVFLTPEYYPKTLSIGQEISVQEASRVIGKVKVLEIYNEILKNS